VKENALRYSMRPKILCYLKFASREIQDELLESNDFPYGKPAASRKMTGHRLNFGEAA
jgi:hypothetical protein